MRTTSDLPPPMNHVFVNFENVHTFYADLLGTKAVSFVFLLGPRQTKLDAGLVEKMLEHASAVELIRLTSSGNNALDFVLAYNLGRKSLADPTANFHIISKDKGYDALIEHLRSCHIHARRHDSFATLTFSRSPKPVATLAPKPEPAGPEESVSRVQEHLRKNVTNRPKKKNTLLRHLKSHLGKSATEADAASLLDPWSEISRCLPYRGTSCAKTGSRFLG